MPSNKEQAKRLSCWLDLAEKHSDHLPHAFKGIGEPGIGILEGYRNGTVEAHIHVGIRSGLLAVSPGYFCARLKARDHFAPPEDATRHNATDREIVKGENIATKGTKVVGRGRLKLSVLVPNYKGFKQSKGGRLLAEHHLYGWYFSMIVPCLTWMPGILSLTFFLKSFLQEPIANCGLVPPFQCGSCPAPTRS